MPKFFIKSWRNNQPSLSEPCLLVKNYRPVSVSSIVTKIFERLMQSQLSEHINQFLSPFLYTKRWKDGKLFLLIERWKIMLHNKGYTDTVLMDLTKALSITNYELLTAKLHTWI